MVFVFRAFIMIPMSFTISVIVLSGRGARKAMFSAYTVTFSFLSLPSSQNININIYINIIIDIIMNMNIIIIIII